MRCFGNIELSRAFAGPGACLSGCDYCIMIMSMSLRAWCFDAHSCASCREFTWLLWNGQSVLNEQSSGFCCSWVCRLAASLHTHACKYLVWLLHRYVARPAEWHLALQCSGCTGKFSSSNFCDYKSSEKFVHVQAPLGSMHAACCRSDFAQGRQDDHIFYLGRPGIQTLNRVVS